MGGGSTLHPCTAYKQLVKEFAVLSRFVVRVPSTFVVAMKACGDAGRWEEALALMDDMRRDGTPPMETTYTTAVRENSAQQDLPSARCVDVRASVRVLGSLCSGVLCMNNTRVVRRGCVIDDIRIGSIFRPPFAQLLSRSMQGK